MLLEQPPQPPHCEAGVAARVLPRDQGDQGERLVEDDAAERADHGLGGEQVAVT
jgi:hypothetical protein